MNPPKDWSRVVNGLRYSTRTALLIAHDAYWDGHNFERGGRNTFLYRTPHGRYFTVNLTQWQGETDTLIPVSVKEAQEMYEELHEQVVPFEEAFPDVIVKEA